MHTFTQQSIFVYCQSHSFQLACPLCNSYAIYSANAHEHLPPQFRCLCNRLYCLFVFFIAISFPIVRHASCSTPPRLTLCHLTHFGSIFACIIDALLVVWSGRIPKQLYVLKAVRGVCVSVSVGKDVDVDGRTHDNKQALSTG